MKDVSVLVLSAGGPAGVNYMKAIKLGGITRVFGADSNLFHLSLCNKNCVKSFLIPRADKEDYIDKINDLLIHYDIGFLHTQSDAEVKVISDWRDSIQANVFLPRKKTIDLCQDKYATAVRWASKWPEATPSYIYNRYELPPSYKDLFDGRKWWVRAVQGAGGKASSPIDTLEQLDAWLTYWFYREPNVKKFILQPYLPGRNIAWQSVWYDGELITSQARERVEYIYPSLAPSGITGTPCVQRTLNEDKINDNAIEAVKLIDQKPHGIFSVDLKENKDGRPVPTEINAGRFFTTSYFFAYGGEMFKVEGANMPWIYTMMGILKKPLYYKSNVNVLPEGIYWIRHIDCGHKLTTKECLDL